jgi:hypothetical protein
VHTSSLPPSFGAPWIFCTRASEGKELWLLFFGDLGWCHVLVLADEKFLQMLCEILQCFYLGVLLQLVL